MLETVARLSRRTDNLTASPIREILAVIGRPGMISFAGGLPAAETFPDFDAGAVPREYLQYGPSEGEPALRQRIADHLRSIGLACPAERILVLSGSQQGIDLAAKLFIDDATPVAVESPTYLAALQVFRYFGARMVAFDPRRPGALPARVSPSLLYAIPTFQNPTGRCYTAAERDALAGLCDEREVPLFEDDPYRDLAYDPCERAPVCARLRRTSWIYQGSFSKSLAPGVRLGFLAASPDLFTPLVRLKQAADLHSSRIGQWLVLRELDDPGRDERLAALVRFYRARRDAFAAELARTFGELATWQIPPGGLFFWLWLRRRVDTRALLARSIERGVAFMPGEPFFPDERSAAPALRLNFSHATPDDAARGLATLAGLVRDAPAGA
jgi:DNA-binding transcriptional MocR family regulator